MAAPFGPVNTFNDLTPGAHTITIRDANLCPYNFDFSIYEPNSLQIDSLVKVDPFCDGSSDGSVNSFVSGGTEPYTYLWSNSETTPGLQNIMEGTYTLTVQDLNGCSDQASITLKAPTSIQLSFDSTAVSCYGGLNGSASVNATGGTEPYTYLWTTTPSSTTRIITNLTADVYNVIVTDKNNCSASGSVSVIEPDTLIANVDASSGIIDVKCNGDATGAAYLTVTGGNFDMAYQYSWSNGDSSQNISNVTAGSYVVTVTDHKGCIDIATVTITQPDPLGANAVLVRPTCPGFSDGLAGVSGIGGTSPYTYSWQGGITSLLLSDLPLGTYYVTVIDSNLSVFIDSVEVTEFSQVWADFIADPYETTILTPEIDFLDSSVTEIENIRITGWQWEFGDGAISDIENPTHEYGDTGSFNVTLIVTTEDGCTASVMKTIRIIDESTMYIPNAFTPDGDGINDYFGVKAENIAEFEMYIYNRWGEMIFKTEDQDDLWNGKKNNEGDVSPDGVYVYIVISKDHQGRVHRHIGHVTLLQ
ncbi:gliding motility-associated C-terminal domain-containing protein [Bacteroidales bacterium AH-315-N07]|nr:gliding motility-associated C-terminal domain-containing protein [Bacteroidales bacterium AH-315-N07]